MEETDGLTILQFLQPLQDMVTEEPAPGRAATDFYLRTEHG